MCEILTDIPADRLPINRAMVIIARALRLPGGDVSYDVRMCCDVDTEAKP